MRPAVFGHDIARDACPSDMLLEGHVAGIRETDADGERQPLVERLHGGRSQALSLVIHDRSSPLVGGQKSLSARVRETLGGRGELGDCALKRSPSRRCV